MAGINLGVKIQLPPMPKLPRWCALTLILTWIGVYFIGNQLETMLVTQPHQRAVETLLNTAAESYRKDIDQRIDQLIQEADKLASDPNTLKILRSPRQTINSIVRTARVPDVMTPYDFWHFSAKTQVAGTERIFLLAPNTDKFPIPDNFVAEILYQQTLAGETPPPRAAKTRQWYIYIARPVRDGDQVVGALLLEIQPAVLMQAIARRHDEAGRISLIQQVGDFPEVAFYFRGNGWKDEFSAKTATNLPGWLIGFSGSKQTIDGAMPEPWPYYGAALLLVLVASALSIIIVVRYIQLPESTAQPASRPRRRADVRMERQAREQGKKSSENASSRDRTSVGDDGASNDLRLLRHVFRDYDIRGKAGSELTKEFAAQLGRVVGNMVLQEGETQLALCADGRKSSPALKTAFGLGVLSTGCDLIDLGTAPTPVMNFALATLEDCRSGVMVTASHNPKEDNGFKIIIDNQVLSSEQILDLRERMAEEQYAGGSGQSSRLDIRDHYIEKVVADILPPGNLRIAIDSGNGIAGEIAPTLFRELGCKVTELFSEMDGDFPNHPPDPTVSANLRTLIETVRNQRLDLGLAFDGDGDRLVAVTGTGRIVWPDELLMIFARDIVARNPGADIIYDVKSTRRLHPLITSYGGRPVMWKTGHAHIRSKVYESGAPLGGEFSGHIFFADRWFGFDDALYAAARLLEIIAIREQSLEEIVASLPQVCNTEEIKIPIPENRKSLFMKELLKHSDFGDAILVKIDGLRVEYDHGWGLIRTSNTSAALTLRFEADTPAALESIMATFKTQLKRVDSSLPLNF